jgi:hypothetical protein
MTASGAVSAHADHERAATPARRFSGASQYRVLQTALFSLGAILVPLGMVAIYFGWYGAAHTKYDYDQLPYLISGGVVGLGCIFIGGFLYFGAWLVKLADDQRAATDELVAAVLSLRGEPAVAVTGGTATAPGMLVLVGAAGTTVHRYDCALLAHSDDLHPLTGTEMGLSTCRVCQPDWP